MTGGSDVFYWVENLHARYCFGSRDLSRIFLGIKKICVFFWVLSPSELFVSGFHCDQKVLRYLSLVFFWVGNFDIEIPEYIFWPQRHPRRNNSRIVITDASRRIMAICVTSDGGKNNTRNIFPGKTSFTSSRTVIHNYGNSLSLSHDF